MMWMDRAACLTANPETFFAVGNGGRSRGGIDLDAEALAICGRCPVMDACRESDDAIDITDTWGTLAGRTEDQRRDAKRTAAMDQQRDRRREVRAKSSAKTREYAKQARVVLPSSRRAS